MSKESKKPQPLSEPAGESGGEDRRKPASSSPKVSRFMVILVGIVGVLLLIVNDSVTVHRLVSEISSLDSTYSDMKIQNDSLQAELRRLSSAERITRIASQRLGFVYSSQTMEQIQVDKGRLEQAEKEDARDSTK